MKDTSDEELMDKLRYAHKKRLLIRKK